MGCLFGKKEFRIILLGLNGAGKKTIISKLKRTTFKSNPKYVGHILEYCNYKNLNIILWETYGQYKLRALWKHFYQNTAGVIFVVDSNDKESIEDAAIELQKALNEEELKDCCILVMANKEDINSALSKDEVTEKLGMENLQGKKWLVESTSAITGKGLQEGLDWILSELLKKKK